MVDICKRLPCISLIPECGQSIRHLHISHFSHYIIPRFPPPKLFTSIVFSFSWGAGSWGGGQQGVLWEICKWWIAPLFTSRRLCLSVRFCFAVWVLLFNVLSIFCITRHLVIASVLNTKKGSRKMTKLYDIKSIILRLAQIPTSPLTPIGSFIHCRRVRYSAKCVIGRSWSTAWGPSLVMMWRHFTGDQSPRLRMLLNENFQWIR